MSLDHGMLNLPLAKRGNINAQLDAYKADQAGAQKAAAKARVSSKALAKIAYVELISATNLIENKAKTLNVDPQALIAKLLEWKKWQPELVIKARREWLSI